MPSGSRRSRLRPPSADRIPGVLDTVVHLSARLAALEQAALTNTGRHPAPTQPSRVPNPPNSALNDTKGVRFRSCGGTTAVTNKAVPASQKA